MEGVRPKENELAMAEEEESFFANNKPVDGMACESGPRLSIAPIKSSGLNLGSSRLVPLCSVLDTMGLQAMMSEERCVWCRNLCGV